MIQKLIYGAYFPEGITDWERKLANVTKCNVNKWEIWLIAIDKGSWTMETSSEALASHSLQLAFFLLLIKQDSWTHHNVPFSLIVFTQTC